MMTVFITLSLIFGCALVVLLGIILIISCFRILAEIIEDFCYDYPSDLEYFDEDGNIKKKEDNNDGI